VCLENKQEMQGDNIEWEAVPRRKGRRFMDVTATAIEDFFRDPCSETAWNHMETNFVNELRKGTLSIDAYVNMALRMPSDMYPSDITLAGKVSASVFNMMLRNGETLNAGK